MTTYHSTCSLCGHHTSALVASRCTVFVPLPPDADLIADYCGCHCLLDPAVWEFAGRPALDEQGNKVFCWATDEQA